MVGKANRTLGMLKKTFESSDPKFWKDLYVSLVRSRFENVVQAWSPPLQADIEKVEIVHSRAARIPTGLEKLEYEMR